MNIRYSIDVLESPRIASIQPISQNPENNLEIGAREQEFLPKGGLQNARFHFLYLNHFISPNGCLIKNLKQTRLPHLKNTQISAAKTIVKAPLTFTRPDGLYTRSCTFGVYELLNYLLAVNSPHIKVERIDLIGGALRRLLFLSKEWWESTFKSLGIELPEFLINDFLNQSPTLLSDVDLRFRLSNASLTDLCFYTENIVGFLRSRLTEFSSEWIRGGGSFKKFNKVKVFEQEDTYKINPHTLFTIASFGELKIPQLSAAPTTLELVFAGKFKREFLFVHDAIRLNILEYNNECVIESDYQNGWQAAVDLFLQTIHVINPKTVDATGFLRVISYLTQGWILPDKWEWDASGPATEKVNVLETLKTTFLKWDSYQQVQAINKCLDNHHIIDSITRFSFLYNLAICIEKEVDSSSLISLFKSCAESAGLKGLPAIICEALCNEKMAFAEINAIMGLGVFCLLGQTDVNDMNPAIAFKRHREEVYVQLKFRRSFLLIPFNPLENLKTLKKFVSERTSENSLKLLIKIFSKLIRFKSNQFPKESLLIAHQNYFFGLYQKLIDEAQLMSLDSDSSLICIAYHVLLSLADFSDQSIFLLRLFPVVIAMPHVQKKKLHFLEALIRGLSAAKYQFICSSLHKIKLLCEKDSSKEIIKKWLIDILAASQDQVLSALALHLYNTYNADYEEQERLDFTIKLLLSLLPAGFQEALTLCKVVQENRQYGCKAEEEKEIVLKLLSQTKREDNLPSIKKMGHILVNFLTHIKENNEKIVKDVKFEEKSLRCVKRLIDAKELLGAKRIMELLVDLGWVDVKSSKAMVIWSLLSEEFQHEEHIQEKCYEAVIACSPWENTKLWNYIVPSILLLAENFIKKTPLMTKGFTILKRISAREKGKKETFEIIKNLIQKHIASIFQENENPKIPSSYSKYLNFEERINYRISLIDKYIALKNDQEACKTWRELFCPKSIEREPLEIARLTERFLDYLLCEKKVRCWEFAALIMTDQQFYLLIPHFKEFWIARANQYLQVANEKKFPPSKKEAILCLAMDLALSEEKNRSETSLLSLISHLFDFWHAQSNSILLRPRLNKYGKSIIDVLAYHKRYQDVLKYMALFEKYQIEVNFEKEQATVLVIAVHKVSELSTYNDKAISPYSEGMNFLLNSKTERFSVENDELLKCFKALCDAYINGKLFPKAFLWIKKCIGEDAKCLYENEYQKWIQIMAGHDLEEALQLFIFLVETFNNFAFQSAFETIRKASLQKPSVGLLNLFNHHYALFCNHGRKESSLAVITHLVKKFLRFDSNKQTIQSCFNLLNLCHLPLDPPFWDQIFKIVLRIQDGEILKASWALFEPVIRLFVDTNNSLEVCLENFINMLFHNGQINEEIENLLAIFEKNELFFDKKCASLWIRCLLEYGKKQYVEKKPATFVRAIEFYSEALIKLKKCGLLRERGHAIIEELIRNLAQLYLEDSSYYVFVDSISKFLGIFFDVKNHVIIEWNSGIPCLYCKLGEDTEFIDSYFLFFLSLMHQLLLIDKKYTERTIHFIDKHIYSIIDLVKVNTESPEIIKCELLARFLDHYFFWMPLRDNQLFDHYYKNAQQLFGHAVIKTIFVENSDLKIKGSVYFCDSRFLYCLSEEKKSLLFYQILDSVLQNNSECATKIALNILSMDLFKLLKNSPSAFQKYYKKILEKIAKNDYRNECLLFKELTKIIKNIFSDHRKKTSQGLQIGVSIYFSFFSTLFPLIDNYRDLSQKAEALSDAVDILFEGILFNYFSDHRSAFACCKHLNSALVKASSLITPSFLKLDAETQTLLGVNIFHTIILGIITLVTRNPKLFKECSNIMKFFFDKLFDGFPVRVKISLINMIGPLLCKNVPPISSSCQIEYFYNGILEYLRIKLEEIPVESILEKEIFFLAENIFSHIPGLLNQCQIQTTKVFSVMFAGRIFSLLPGLPKKLNYIPLFVLIADSLDHHAILLFNGEPTALVFCNFLESFINCFEDFVLTFHAERQIQEISHMYEQLLNKLIDITNTYVELKSKSEDLIKKMILIFIRAFEKALPSYDDLKDTACKLLYLANIPNALIHILKMNMPSWEHIEQQYCSLLEKTIIKGSGYWNENQIAQAYFFENFLLKTFYCIVDLRQKAKSETIKVKCASLIGDFLEFASTLVKAKAIPLELVNFQIKNALEANLFYGEEGQKILKKYANLSL